MATFYSRSRAGRWCKGETSGHFIHVTSVHPDCDRDSIIYMGNPIGPACHTVRFMSPSTAVHDAQGQGCSALPCNAPVGDTVTCLLTHVVGGHLLTVADVVQGATSCWFSSVGLSSSEGVSEMGQPASRDEAPLSTLLALERTIKQRREESGAGTSA